MTTHASHAHSAGAGHQHTPSGSNTDCIAHASTPETLLAHLAGQPIDETALKSGLIFLATSITLLWGVMAIDGKIEPQEQSYLQSILDASLQSGKTPPHLVEALVDGIEQHQLYLNPRLFLLLASPLNASERLLLLGLGYDMAAKSEHFGAQERMYLRAIAQRLRIPQSYQACLEASFTEQAMPHPEALPEMAQMTHPTHFESTSALTQLLAQRIHPNMARLATLASA